MAKLHRIVNRHEFIWDDDGRGFQLDIDYLDSTGASSGCAWLSHDEAFALLTFLKVVFDEDQPPLPPSDGGES
jgi:hypothetical protein